MKAKIKHFVTTKKELALASGKEYAVNKGKEMAYRSVNGIMAHPQFQKYDELGVKYINSGIDFTMVKLDKLEDYNKSSSSKTLGVLDKMAKIFMTTGIIVASLGIIGGTLGAFLTANFFWLILTAISIVAFGTVIGAGIAYFKTEESTSQATNPVVAMEEIEVPIITAAVSSIEGKLPKLSFPELKAA